jgi:hypothetical protein
MDPELIAAAQAILKEEWKKVKTELQASPSP